MTKLSEAQRRVLSAMRDGAIIATTFPRKAALVRAEDGAQPLRWPTFRALLWPRYIESIRLDWQGSLYRISEAGRAALQQNGEGEGIDNPE